MKQIASLIKRNFRMYIRDRGAVFFSLLTMLIVIGLMILFLGENNVKNITNILTESGGLRNAETDQKNAEILVLMWTIAGILSVNTITVSLSVIGIMITDFSRKRLQSFYTAPISRMKIALGYIGAAVVCSLLISGLTMIIAETYAVANGAEALGFTAHCKLLTMVFVNSLTYTSIMYFIAMFIVSESAWTGLGTVVGTLAGFLGAIYIPMGALSTGVQGALKCTPVLYGSSMFRKVFTESAMADTFAGLPASVTDEFCKQMGITVFLGDTQINTTMQLAFLILCSIIFLTLSGIIMRKRSVADR